MSSSLRIFQDQSAFPLDEISVASPCHADWADMVGSDKVRFCASCQKNVFNLSGMKRDEAVDLLRATEGKACVRFFRRADGTVLTEDCPVGVALLVKRAKRATLAAAALSVGAVAAMLAVLAGMVGGTFTRRACERIDDMKQTIVDAIPPEPQPLMGAMPMPTLGEPAPAAPIEAPTLGRVKAAPRELKGKVAMPREFKGDVVMPVPAVEDDR